MTKRPKLTETEWRKVFRLRCDAKQGRGVSSADQRLLNNAFREDRERYVALTAPVFEATKPFGSDGDDR